MVESFKKEFKKIIDRMIVDRMIIRKRFPARSNCLNFTVERQNLHFSR